MFGLLSLQYYCIVKRNLLQYVYIEKNGLISMLVSETSKVARQAVETQPKKGLWQSAICKLS